MPLALTAVAAAMLALMPDSFFTVFAAIIGLCFGSFAGVVVYRIPRGESVVRPRSHCPRCGAFLKWRDMVPIVSWLALRGRCRTCDGAVGPRYLMMEITCAVLFVLMAGHTGISFNVIPLWCLAFVLLCVGVVDFDTMEIPDGLLLFGALAGVAWGVLVYDLIGWVDALLGVAAGALPLWVLDRAVWLVAKKPGFGFGDVKLMGMAGLFLGWQGVVAAYFVAFVAGGVFGVFLMVSGRAERGSYLAFGPFLALGVLVAMLN